MDETLEFNSGVKSGKSLFFGVDGGGGGALLRFTEVQTETPRFRVKSCFSGVSIITPEQEEAKADSVPKNPGAPQRSEKLRSKDDSCFRRVTARAGRAAARE